MKEILDKLTSYNLFNYLLPGVLVAALSGQVSTYDLLQKDIVVGAFLYYFVGLVVSRIGSVIVEPLLKMLKIVKFSKYEDFVKASRVDAQVETLSEGNNTYRGLLGAIMTLGILSGYSAIESALELPLPVRFSSLGLTLLLLFVFSYRKQSQYINKRVEAARARGEL